MRRKSIFLQMRFFKWVICRVVRRIAYKCDFLRCIYVALKMDATYMQKDKIAHRCEIATIALTSRFQYETYAAYISMSHISADMTFALRTHCFFDGAYVRFLQSDVCAFSFRWQICRIFSMRRMWHWEIIRTYVSSGSSYLRAISVERNTSCIVYNATYVSFWINLIYVSFLESHLCRIHYHMRRMFHLLNAINTASASTCRIRRICGMQALSHLESPPLTSRWTASDKNRTLPSTPNFSDMLLDLGVPVAGKSRIRPYPSAFSPRNFLYRNYIEK